MKKYIKPMIKKADIEAESLLANSVSSVSGLQGVTVSEEEFAGGTADSRSNSQWDDDED